MVTIAAVSRRMPPPFLGLFHETDIYMAIDDKVLLQIKMPLVVVVAACDNYFKCLWKRQ